MSLFMAMIYDRFMDATEEACLRRWRGELLADLEGDVLELGAGTGANLPHHPRDLSRLVLTEPDKHMRRQLEARAREHRPDAEVTPASARAARTSSRVGCGESPSDGRIREITPSMPSWRTSTSRTNGARTISTR